MEKIISTWLYKKGSEPKIFKGVDINKALKNGWVDTPAKFNVQRKPVIKKVIED